LFTLLNGAQFVVVAVLKLLFKRGKYLNYLVQKQLIIMCTLRPVTWHLADIV